MHDIPLAPTIVLDAEWAPVPPTDEDLMRDRAELDAALELAIRECGMAASWR